MKTKGVLTMFCNNCGNFAPEGSAVCPYCSSPLGAQNAQGAQPNYQQPTYQQPTYQQPTYQPPAYQPPAYQQPAYQPTNPEISTAKTLGIVSIITAILCFTLASFICGGIGISKANSVLALNPTDPLALEAKKYNKIGLILAGVLTGLYIVVYIFLIIAGVLSAL